MDKQIKVTLKRSTIGCTQKQKATVEALGLKKIGSANVIADNDSTKGMLKLVAHLVSVEEA
ncbi:MAG TPA: 50S ribosomal protein L30 [Candidatus Ornithoclostridium excrementipullorum]|nr:50S ribosomal protein L30 [Candidatus Ornithoclostridium excrementipullorum]